VAIEAVAIEAVEIEAVAGSSRAAAGELRGLADHQLLGRARSPSTTSGEAVSSQAWPPPSSSAAVGSSRSSAAGSG
jgi:hypothetical protein